MPTIRRTAENKIITKDGKPSCGCCGPCTPDVLTVYVEQSVGPVYFEMDGSLNVGTFLSDPAGFSIEWIGGEWVMSQLGIDFEPLQDNTIRCDPQGIYRLEVDDTTLDFTVSFSPLP